MGADNKCSALWHFIVFLLMVVPIIPTRGETTTSLFMVGLGDNNAMEDLTVEEGDTVSIVCHVVDLAEEQVVSMTRVTESGGNESLLWNNNATSSANTKHIEFDGFVDIGANMFLYTIVVHNVTKYDAGTYSCKVFTQFGNRFTPVANADSELSILHLPDAIYPICTIISTNKSLTRYADDRVTFRCESEVGNPEVFMDWMLSSRGPELPRAKEVVENGITYTEIVVDLKTGHSGKEFECVMTTGLDITYHPKCIIGPFNVQRRPTTPKPQTTLIQKITTMSNVNPTLEPTSPSDITMQSKNPTGGTPAGLSKAAVAGICVIIALTIGIVVILVIAYLIKTNRCASLESKSPLADSNPGLGIGNIGNSIAVMMNTSIEDPELLGFKRRISKKASLKSETDSDMSGEYDFENGRLVLDFDTIAEGQESPRSNHSNSHRPIPVIPPFQSNSDDHESTLSPTSPQPDQPFLPEPQTNEGFVTPPASPSEMVQAEEPSAQVESDVPLTPSPPATPKHEEPVPSSRHLYAEIPSPSRSVDEEDNILEGDFVTDDSDQEQDIPDHLTQEQDPSMPQNLPQDVMDILMDLDLDLFANEETEDTDL